MYSGKTMHKWSYGVPNIYGLLYWTHDQISASSLPTMLFFFYVTSPHMLITVQVLDSGFFAEQLPHWQFPKTKLIYL